MCSEHLRKVTRSMVCTIGVLKHTGARSKGCAPFWTDDNVIVYEGVVDFGPSFFWIYDDSAYD